MQHLQYVHVIRTLKMVSQEELAVFILYLGLIWFGGVDVSIIEQHMKEAVLGGDN